jgi:hypothetical protein
MDFKITPIKVESLAYAIRWATINDSPLFDDLLSYYIKLLPSGEDSYIEEDLMFFLESLARRQSSVVLKFKPLSDYPVFVNKLESHTVLRDYINISKSMDNVQI